MPNFDNLPWNFEAFRRFIDYKTLQRASGVLVLNDNKPLFSGRKEMEDFQSLLSDRTGLDWVPDRNVSEDILFNTEGNVFRNKARVFTSLFLVDPRCFQQHGVLKVTDFCRALASGYIKEKEFYETIFKRYQYPHPAYAENWTTWKSANIRLKPFIFILQILLELSLENEDWGYITVKEFAVFAHPNPFHDKTKEIAKAVLESRRTGKMIAHQRSDEVDRKISDLLGFLCMSGFSYYVGNNVKLNLIKRHPVEKAFFLGSRFQESIYEDIKLLIKEGLEEI